MATHTQRGTQNGTKPRSFSTASNQNGHAPTNGANKLPFSKKFQDRVLRLCIEEPTWLAHLKPSCFDHPMQGQVLKTLQAMPPKSVSPDTLVDELKRTEGKSVARAALRPRWSILREPLTEKRRLYLEAALPKFIDMQRIGEAFVKATPLYQRQDVAGLRKLLESAVKPLPGDAQPLKLRRLSDVKMERITWWWQRRIEAGTLHLIGGDPGTGKGLMVADLIARITRGKPWPDGDAGRGKPMNVAILTAEEHAGKSLKPRILGAGGDPNRVFVRDVRDGGRDINAHIQWLEQFLVKTKAAVLVIDTINDFLGDIDGHRLIDAKLALAPWTAMAARCNVAILGITHLTKANDRTALQKFMGSVGFIATARLGFLVTMDDEDPTRQRRLFLPAKSPNDSAPAKPLAFTISNTQVIADGQTVNVGKVTWSSVGRHVDPDTVLRNLQRGLRPKDEASRVLKEELQHGPRSKTQIAAKLEAAEITMATARRAKEELDIETVQYQRRWYWGPPGWSKKRIRKQLILIRKKKRAAKSDAHSPAKVRM